MEESGRNSRGLLVRAPPTGQATDLAPKRTNQERTQMERMKKKLYKRVDAELKGVERRERGRERDIGMGGKRECCIINPFAS